MRTAAILPVKRFAQAKQRLGASVADPLRLELARAMVGDVLAALAETAAIELTIVVTGEPSVAETTRARAGAAIVIDDTAQDGQSAAVGLGVRRALDAGIERVLCIPGDCPTLDPAELEALLGVRPDVHSASGAEVVIVPDRHGSGTNGLLLVAPRGDRPQLRPRQPRAPHRARARRRGRRAHRATSVAAPGHRHGRRSRGPAGSPLR